MTLLPGKQITGHIVTVKRLRNSVNGNGRFEITLADGTKYRTATDAAVSYAVENIAPWSDGNYVPVTLVLNGRGSVIDIERG